MMGGGLVCAIDEATCINGIQGKRILVFGDSTMGDASQGSVALCDLLEDEHGATVINKAVGGTGVWTERGLQDQVEGTTRGEFEASDIILVAFATNDWQGNTPVWESEPTRPGFVQGLSAGIMEMRKNGAVGEIVYVSPAYGHRDFGGLAMNRNEQGAYLEDYCVAGEIVCQHLGISILPLHRLFEINESNFDRYLYVSEGTEIYVHYSQELKEMIAKLIASECFLAPFGYGDGMALYRY